LNSIPWGDVVYVGAWIVFAFLAYQVSQFETTEGYDPYKILGVPAGTTDCALTALPRVALPCP
jgi:preprotein translocase subunit Sec63